MLRVTVGPAEKAAGGTTVYAVELRHEGVAEWAAEEPVVAARRRYSEFAELHAALSAAAATAGASRPPPVPGKTIITTSAVLAERQRAFEALLSFAAGSPALRSLPAFAAFVGAKAPLVQGSVLAAQQPWQSAPAAQPPPPPAAALAFNDNPLEAEISALGVAEEERTERKARAAAAAAASGPSGRPKPAVPPPAAASSQRGGFTPFGGASAPPSAEYTPDGQGLREAIKAQDTEAVTRLLAKGVPADFRDPQGQTMLHIAALFNCTDIAEVLVAAGADVGAKNAQGETVLDVAPVMLASKLRAAAKR